MLDALEDQRSAQQRMRDALRGLPQSYLPRRFKVSDACLTNAPILWLGKHFYP